MSRVSLGKVDNQVAIGVILDQLGLDVLNEIGVSKGEVLFKVCIGKGLLLLHIVNGAGRCVCVEQLSLGCGVGLIYGDVCRNLCHADVHFLSHVVQLLLGICFLDILLCHFGCLNSFFIFGW